MAKHTLFRELTRGYITINVDEQDGESNMKAYMACPKQSGSYGGVIVGCELFGLTAHIRNIVERIAQLGYVVIAPDIYHRTAPGTELAATPEGRKQGFTLLHQLTRTQAINDIRAVINYLQTSKQITAIAMVGFSVGGHIAYLAATSLPLKASIAFYPGWLTVPEIPLSQPEPTVILTPGISQYDTYLLLLMGKQDMLISEEQYQMICEALQSAGIRHEIVRYPYTGHGFFCDERDSFHEVSARDAWQRLQQVLATELA